MNIIILGGGISGLLAAYALRAFKPMLLEASPALGGNYTAGGLKYIRQTEEMIALLRDLDIPWTAHIPVGQLLWNGVVHAHPRWLNSMDEHERRFIQAKHWNKTRGVDRGFRLDCMNDPLGNGADPALICDHSTLLTRLITEADEDVDFRLGVGIAAVDANTVHLVGGGSIPFTHLVTTIPLATMGRLAPWAELPAGISRPLTILDHIVDDKSPSWDYMYTPDLEMTSRISWPSSGHIQVEVPGNPDIAALVAGKLPVELRTALSHYSVNINYMGSRVIPGHLQPLIGDLRYPPNWTALGRFASWNPRQTAERVYAEALTLAGVLA